MANISVISTRFYAWLRGNSVGMTDLVAMEFIPWKKIICRRKIDLLNVQNSVGITDTKPWVLTHK
jgi:hypothetical protein